MVGDAVIESVGVEFVCSRVVAVLGCPGAAEYPHERPHSIRSSSV